MTCSLSRTLGQCEVVLGKGWNERVGRTKWGTNATSGVLVATWAARSRCETYIYTATDSSAVTTSTSHCQSTRVSRAFRACTC